LGGDEAIAATDAGLEAVHEPRALSSLGLALMLLAPYLSVIVFWCLLGNAWLAILGYHAQILLWARGRLPDLRRPALSRLVWSLAPAALAGPALYAVLPYVTRTDVGSWLASHGLSGLSLLAMVGYFGLVHPFLEQAHWGPLRERTPLAHVMFAGYHVIVLYQLLTWPWLALSFAVLCAASVMWGEMSRRTGGLTLPIASHVLADLGIVIAALLRTRV
jgi:hypothetical protein